jgi:hypothetical protein
MRIVITTKKILFDDIHYYDAEYSYLLETEPKGKTKLAFEVLTYSLTRPYKLSNGNWSWSSAKCTLRSSFSLRKRFVDISFSSRSTSFYPFFTVTTGTLYATRESHLGYVEGRWGWFLDEECDVYDLFDKFKV